MFGLFVMGLIGLIVVILLALFIVPFFVALIPITLVGLLLWIGVRWFVGLAWFLVMGVVSLLQTLWRILF